MFRAMKVHNLEVSCKIQALWHNNVMSKYEGWNFNSGNYLFTTDTK